MAISLIDLEGTEKQVKWAATIRAEVLAKKGNLMQVDRPTEITPAIEAMAQKGGVPADVALCRLVQMWDAAMAARSDLESKASASWWIDNRYSVDNYVRDAYNAKGKSLWTTKQ